MPPQVLASGGTHTPMSQQVLTRHLAPMGHAAGMREQSWIPPPVPPVLPAPVLPAPVLPAPVLPALLAVPVSPELPLAVPVLLDPLDDEVEVDVDALVPVPEDVPVLAVPDALDVPVLDVPVEDDVSSPQAARPTSARERVREARVRMAVGMGRG